ncbi:MAG: hypothetical protein PVG30_05655 [Gammaproteobacteria bacterium]|jgi:hypothetical protein
MFNVSQVEKKVMQIIKKILQKSKNFYNKKCIITNDQEIIPYIVKYLYTVPEDAIILCLQESIIQDNIVYRKDKGHVHVLKIDTIVFENKIKELSELVNNIKGLEKK